jgi:hypothetical protein
LKSHFQVEALRARVAAAEERAAAAGEAASLVAEAEARWREEQLVGGGGEGQEDQHSVGIALVELQASGESGAALRQLMASQSVREMELRCDPKARFVPRCSEHPAGRVSTPADPNIPLERKPSELHCRARVPVPPVQPAVSPRTGLRCSVGAERRRACFCRRRCSSTRRRARRRWRSCR